MSSKPCISEVSHSISVNCQNTNREGSQQTSEAPVHMAFASSAQHWELPALLLVWKALGLVWKAALRATTEDRVSLSGCGPGKRGGGSEARLWLWSNIPPPLLAGWSVIPGTIPHSRGRGWGLGDGHRVRTGKEGEVGETSGMRKERNCPLQKEIFFSTKLSQLEVHGLVALLAWMIYVFRVRL